MAGEPDEEQVQRWLILPKGTEFRVVTKRNTPSEPTPRFNCPDVHVGPCRILTTCGGQVRRA